ncbi:MAG: YihY family inner membrane protein [Spirochaetales bacterium]|nr:YihY family inner membrane protein [Spirochaetales bacterium]
MNVSHHPAPAGLFAYLKKLLTLIIRDRIPARASGLAFTTILAMVPLMTMLISFGSRELVEGPVKELIMTTILPTSQEMVFNQLTSFAENSRKLGTWGLVITIVVVFLLINKIELDVNALLRARPNRGLLTRLAIYMVTLIFSTLTVGSSFSLTNDLIQIMTMKLTPRFTLLQVLFSSLGSIVLIGMTILLLIMLVSSARIRWKSALTGALAGAILWEFAKKAFSLWATYSIRNSVIYGSLFMIPILFIWINLAWIIILSSLEVAYLHQHPGYLLYLEDNSSAPALQTVMTIKLYLIIAGEFREGKKPPQLEDLSASTGLPETEVLSLLDRLIKYVLILRTDQKGYLPASDPETVDHTVLVNAALDEASVEACFSAEEARDIWEDFREIRSQRKE